MRHYHIHWDQWGWGGVLAVVVFSRYCFFSIVVINNVYIAFCCFVIFKYLTLTPIVCYSQATSLVSISLSLLMSPSPIDSLTFRNLFCCLCWPLYRCDKSFDVRTMRIYTIVSIETFVREGEFNSCAGNSFLFKTLSSRQKNWETIKLFSKFIF